MSVQIIYIRQANLRPYNYVQTNNYCYCIGVVSWNHIIVYKLIVLDRNACDHTTECKSFVLD